MADPTLVPQAMAHVLGVREEQDKPLMETVQGFNIRQWKSHGFGLWAVSDLNADELEDFGRKFEIAQH